MKTLIGAFLLAATSVLADPAGAATFTARLDPIVPTRFSNPNTGIIRILVGLTVEGLDGVVNLADAPGLDVSLYFTEGVTPFSIHGLQLGSAFPDGPVVEVPGSSYCRPDSDNCITFGPGIDPRPDAPRVAVSFLSLNLPASGQMLRFELTAPAGSPVGEWHLVARVTADDGLSALTPEAIGVARLSISAIPEPATGALMLVGIVIAGGAMRRRRATATA